MQTVKSEDGEWSTTRNWNFRMQISSLQSFVLLLMVASIQKAKAQQNYGSLTGYVCSGAVHNCSAYAMYRTMTDGQETVNSVSAKFGIGASAIAGANGMDLVQGSFSGHFRDQQPLYIPISCRCVNGTSLSEATWEIIGGDTFWLTSVDTFGGLTTYQAIERLNPEATPINLLIGQFVNIPIFCACPTAQQGNAGVNYLLTYVIKPNDTINSISSCFNVSKAEVLVANNLTVLHENATMQSNTTLLIPMAKPPKQLSTVQVSAAPPLAPILASPPLHSPSASTSPIIPTPAVSLNKGNRVLPIVFGLTGGVVGVMLLVALVLWLSRCHHMQQLDERPLQAAAEEKYLDTLLRRFSYNELHAATQGFNKELGRGGFGHVYKGVLPGGATVAVKRLMGRDGGASQSDDFGAEVQTIGSIHHLNLVRLHGFCVEGSHRLLVYEFMSNGSLDRFLFAPSSNSECLLHWVTRMDIAYQTARGLAYLHEDCSHKIIHLDIKPQNILLDENFLAKVGDFGLSKLLEREQSCIQVSHIMGTRGYTAPEWAESPEVTEKADVYSYGIVLLELISGRKNVDPHLEQQGSESWYYAPFALGKANEGKHLDILDVQIRDEMTGDYAKRVIQIALWCIQLESSLRPSMKTVLQWLEGVRDVPGDPPFHTPPQNERRMARLRDLAVSLASSTDRYSFVNSVQQMVLQRREQISAPVSYSSIQPRSVLPYPYMNQRPFT